MYERSEQRIRTDGGTDPIRVGLLLPYSGGLGWIGPNAYRGIRTALEEAGGVNDATVFGREIELVDRDTETSPTPALSGFDSLVAEDVVAVVGPSSSTAPSLVDRAQSSGMPVISVCAGTVQLDGVGGEFVWRTVPSDSVGARAQARFAYEELGAEEMALAYKNDRGSKSFSTTAGEYFEDLGGSVVAETALDASALTYRSQIRELEESGADVVSMTAGTEVSRLFVQQYATSSAADAFDILLGNDVVYDEFVTEMGSGTMEGMYGQAPSPGPGFEAFRESHRTVTDSDPGAFAASSYDAMNLVALAFVREGEVTRRAIPNNFPAIGSPSGQEVTTFRDGKDVLQSGGEINYTGATNPLNFDDNGDPLGSFTILQASGGEWVERHEYAASDLAREA